MELTLPRSRVVQPLHHRGLSVFPLFFDAQPVIEYRLAHEALADGQVDVREIDSQGSVSQLRVRNRGDLPVLFLEGEELIGARQNRVLNATVLVPSRSRLRLPVSCVEQGRWHPTSECFSLSGSFAPAGLRGRLKSSVNRSIRHDRGCRSDQSAVWDEVASLQQTCGGSSATTAMSDTFQSQSANIQEFQSALPYVSGAGGLAIAAAGDIVSIDLFDKPATCRKIWSRILSGAFFDGLASASAGNATAGAVADLLRSPLRWRQNETVGEGDEYRSRPTSGVHASALLVHQTLIHASLLLGV